MSGKCLPGWKAGQPLKHVTQTFSRKLHFEIGGSYGERSWSNRKAPQYINAESLKTTTEAVNDRGVSGAVLAAMLDAFTPPCQGHAAPAGLRHGQPCSLQTTCFQPGSAADLVPPRQPGHHLC